MYRHMAVQVEGAGADVVAIGMYTGILDCGRWRTITK